jgi:hypothetical protein
MTAGCGPRRCARRTDPRRSRPQAPARETPTAVAGAPTVPWRWGTAFDLMSEPVRGCGRLPPPLVPIKAVIGSGNTTVDGKFEGIGRLSGGSVLELTVAGRGGAWRCSCGVLERDDC